MKPNQGFTLLEILLVLVILSLGSMVAVMSLPDHSQEQVQRSAERVFQSMQLLSDEAIFSGRNYGLYVDENKHKLNFLMLTDQGWQPLESSTLKKVVPVDEGVDFRFELGGSVWNNQDRLFKPGSLFEDMDFGETEKKRVYTPQVIILTSGEITSFSIRFWADSTPDKYWTVTTSSDGVLHIKTPQESHDEAS